MLINWIFIVVSLALLYLGAEGLVRGSASLALRLGLTPLVVGLTVVAMGTSMPEVMVSVKAALDGQGNLAVGNVLGSNIFNIGVILGITAMVMPMKVQFQLIKIDTPVMLAVSLLVPVLLLDGLVSRIEGIFLLLGLGIYLVANVWLARKTASKEVEAEFQESMPSRTGSVFLDLVFIIAGLGVLVVGARLLTENSVSIARAYGISEAVIGLTIVAAGTSVPELAASIVAALKKEPDIALGNVVGSNIFNILGVLGAGACAAPMTAMDISAFDMWMVVGVSALLIPILWTGFKVTRFEGAILCAAYGGYVYLMWPK
jgi:cation:H+ antiporter